MVTITRRSVRELAADVISATSGGSGPTQQPKAASGLPLPRQEKMVYLIQVNGCYLWVSLLVLHLFVADRSYGSGLS